MGQRHRDGLDPLFPEVLRSGNYRTLVEGGDDGAVVSCALRYLQDAFRGYGALRFHPDVWVGQPGHAVAPDFQDVLEPLGYQDPDRCALALQDGVGGNCGPVENAPDLGVCDPICSENLGQARDKTPRRVVRGGGSLQQLQFAVVQVQQDNVGECSAHVDCQGIVVHILPTGSLCLRLNRAGTFPVPSTLTPREDACGTTPPPPLRTQPKRPAGASCGPARHPACRCGRAAR